MGETIAPRCLSVRKLAAVRGTPTLARAMNNFLLVVLLAVSAVGSVAAVRWRADQHVRVAPNVAPWEVGAQARR